MWFSKRKPPADEPFFTWSNADYAIGVPTFDQEHERLAALIGNVHDALVDRHDRTQAVQFLETLIFETRAHFDHEERSMAEAGYKSLEAHVSEHEALIQDLQGLMRQFKGGNLSALALPAFLKNWLIPHIQHSDRQYAPILKRYGVK